MATTTKSIKAPKKAPAKSRDPLFSDESHTGREPVWDTERALIMSQADFDHHLRRSFHYYNYYYSQKDAKKYVIEWMKSAEYTKQQISTFARGSDKAIPMTACSIVMAARQGMPLREREMAYLKEQISTALATTELEPEPVGEVGTTKVEPVRLTIQDRLNEKTSEQLAHLEGLYDEVVTGGSAKANAFDYFTVNTVPQSQIGKFEELFTVRKTELTTAQGKTDDQLVEAYKHYKAADYKRHHAFLDEILAACDQYRQVKKATKKARVKRAPNKEKVVSKLKFMKEEKTLKLVSINPVDIIGAQELWCYNHKTRKLFRYVADSLTGPLGVKGTSITGYDVAKSTGKTIRKPEEKLKEFAKAGKIQLRKFMEEIKATETMANGRISADIVLLRVG
jgi:hypothetical protein